MRACKRARADSGAEVSPANPTCELAQATDTAMAIKSDEANRHVKALEQLVKEKKFDEALQAFRRPLEQLVKEKKFDEALQTFRRAVAALDLRERRIAESIRQRAE